MGKLPFGVYNIQQALGYNFINIFCFCVGQESGLLRLTNPGNPYSIRFLHGPHPLPTLTHQQLPGKQHTCKSDGIKFNPEPKTKVSMPEVRPFGQSSMTLPHTFRSFCLIQNDVEPYWNLRGSELEVSSEVYQVLLVYRLQISKICVLYTPYKAREV